MQKNSSLLISVVVSTYNRPEVLSCVLRSLSDQENTSFEVIVADDGSSSSTKDVITKFQQEIKFKLLHVWQEDDGFRAAQIRNKAVAKSSGDYLIFLDGDCLVFSDFIDEHVMLVEAGYFVRGNRVMLSEECTNEFIANNVRMSELSFMRLLRLRFGGKLKRILPLLRLNLNGLRKRKKTDWYGVKTCNLGMWRKDFMAVNGFDEEYIGWGHEDADLAIRLINNGVYRKEGVNAVTVLHLWHPLNDRSHLEENENRLEKRLQSSVTRITHGVSQY